MEKEAFLNIAPIRNIINQKEIQDIVEELIQIKKLKEFPHIQSWVRKNVRKYWINHAPIIEQDFHNLDKENQLFIQEKNIQAPYHLVQINEEEIDNIKHMLDYVLDEFKSPKDLSRLSIPQAKINTNHWLENKIKKLSDEEDPEYVIPTLNVKVDGKEYTWVNIRSHKALKRESKLMNHCVETYWDSYYKTENTQNPSHFYSLRDENNKPIVTAYLSVLSSDKSPDFNFIDILEVKEKNNDFLSHQFRNSFVELFQSLQKKESVIKIEDDSILCKKDYETNKIISVNDFINQGKKFNNYNEPFEFSDFNEYFEKDKLFISCTFNELNIQDRDLNEQHYSAKKITLSNIKANKIYLEGQFIVLNNLSNCEINIQLNEAAHTVSVFGTHLNNCKINTNLSGKTSEINYFFEQSHITQIKDSSEKHHSHIYLLKSNVNSPQFSKNAPCSINEFSEVLSAKKLKQMLYVFSERILIEHTLNPFEHIFLKNIHWEKIVQVKDFLWFKNFFTHPQKALTDLLHEADFKNIGNYVKDVNSFTNECSLEIIKNPPYSFVQELQSQIINNIFGYEFFIESIKAVFIERLKNKDDYALAYFIQDFIDGEGTYYKSSQKSSLLVDMFKNAIIQSCIEVNNELSNSIVSTSQKKLREQKIQRITKRLCIQNTISFFDNLSKKETIQNILSSTDNSETISQFKINYEKQQIQQSIKDMRITENMNSSNKKLSN